MDFFPMEITAEIVCILLRFTTIDDLAPRRATIMAMGLINRKTLATFRSSSFWTTVLVIEKETVSVASFAQVRLKDIYCFAAAMDSLLDADYVPNMVQHPENIWSLVFGKYSMKKDGLLSTLDEKSEMYKKYERACLLIRRIESAHNLTYPHGLGTKEEFMSMLVENAVVNTFDEQKEMLIDYSRTIGENNIVEHDDGCNEALVFISRTCRNLRVYKSLRDAFLGIVSKDKDRMISKMDHIAATTDYRSTRFMDMIHRAPNGAYFVGK